MIFIKELRNIIFILSLTWSRDFGKNKLPKKTKNKLPKKDKYNTSFNVPFGQYEWNVKSFGLTNTLSIFQNIINSIFNQYSHISIVYIDDILIYPEDINLTL